MFKIYLTKLTIKLKINTFKKNMKNQFKRLIMK